MELQSINYDKLRIWCQANYCNASSLGYYATALEIFHEYNDQYRLEKVKGNLEELLQIKDWDAPAAVAQLEINEETKKALLELLEKVQS